MSVMPNPLLSFLQYLCCLLSRRQEFLLFPGACTFEFPVVSLQASTVRRKSLSRSLSSTGESTIWIQNDRFQVLHHHQEGYACSLLPLLKLNNVDNSSMRPFCWYIAVVGFAGMAFMYYNNRFISSIVISVVVIKLNKLFPSYQVCLDITVDQIWHDSYPFSCPVVGFSLFHLPNYSLCSFLWTLNLFEILNS